MSGEDGTRPRPCPVNHTKHSKLPPTLRRSAPNLLHWLTVAATAGNLTLTHSLLSRCGAIAKNIACDYGNEAAALVMMSRLVVSHPWPPPPPDGLLVFPLRRSPRSFSRQKMARDAAKVEGTEGGGTRKAHLTGSLRRTQSKMDEDSGK